MYVKKEVIRETGGKEKVKGTARSDIISEVAENVD